MTTLTAPLKMYVRAPGNRHDRGLCVRRCCRRTRSGPKELPRVQAAGEVAIHLGVALDGLAGKKNEEAAVGAAQMVSIGGTAVIGISVVAYLICLHAKKRLAFNV